MKILYLGSNSPVLTFLRKEENVINTEEKITTEFIKYNDIELIISYGYRHIITSDILFLIPAINLHISYLPFNRGADPNFWSFVEDTSKGVTIHMIDEKLDTGDILLQKEIIFSEFETLKTSYNKLQDEIQNIFINNWPELLKIKPIKQDKGTYHNSSQKKQYVDFIDNYLEISIYQLLNHISDIQMSRNFNTIEYNEIRNPKCQ